MEWRVEYLSIMVKIGTLNTCGGNSQVEHIINTINKNKLDILMVQEVHCMKTEYKNKIENSTNTKAFTSEGSNRGRGVMTFIRESKNISDSKLVSKDAYGNIVIVNVKVHNEMYKIVNVYGPMDSTGRKNLLQKIYDQSHGISNMVLAGDFNNFENFNLDCVGGSLKVFEQKKGELKVLNDMKINYGYVDSYRVLKPHGKLFTYTSRISNNYRARLDRIYIHDSLTPHLSSVDLVPIVYSDHDLYVINLEFNNDDTTRLVWGRGLWKYNSKLLAKKENMRILEERWIEWRNKKYEFRDLVEWWEIGKQRVIKQTCIELGQKEKKAKNDREISLKLELDRLITCPQQSVAKRINEIKGELKQMEEGKIEGIKTRTKLLWQNEGEKCTKFFFNLEKKNGGDKQIHALTKEDGTKVNGKEETLSYLYNHFKTRYMKDHLNGDYTNVLLNTITKRLNNNEREKQAGFFTMEELERVKSRMKPNKSPGNDGLNFNFYKQTWHFMKYDLLILLNEIMAVNRLGLSMTQGLIILIYKNKGERTDISNYRPITLLNTDYKFLTGILSDRISPFLPDLISTDQTCAINGRYMEDNLIMMQDLYDFCNQFKYKSMIMSLDLESAFCRINHDYLHRLLDRLNFGYKIRDLIKTIYDNMYSAVLANGAKTKYFKLDKSIRQGDGISMSLFVLTIEPLANLIRQDKRIEPVIIPNQPAKKISQYCDDTCVITSDVKSIKVVQKLTDIFEKGAGGHLNHNKTEIALLGEWSDEQKRDIPEKNLKVDIKHLGVWFGPNSKQLNRQQITEKMDRVVNFWKTIPLSFEGKKLILNTKLLPVLYHIIRITGMDRNLKCEVQRRINDFFWYPKKMKMIAYDTLQNDVDHGGLNLPNLDVINEAILTERIHKVLNWNPPWTGQFIYRLGFRLRNIKPDFSSSKYKHTFKCTEIGEVIKSTYNKINHKVMDWTRENFASLKLKIHQNMAYKKDSNRNYDNTWQIIQNSTSKRKQKDINYLLAHNALPLTSVLVSRGLKIKNECQLCGSEAETRRHLFMKCKYITDTLKYLQSVIGRTLSEEELIYHEGNQKMRKKENQYVSDFKQTVWTIRALKYYGEVAQQEIESSMVAMLKLKMKKA